MPGVGKLSVYTQVISSLNWNLWTLLEYIYIQIYKYIYIYGHRHLYLKIAPLGTIPFLVFGRKADGVKESHGRRNTKLLVFPARKRRNRGFSQNR